MHHDIDTIERMRSSATLRLGTFDAGGHQPPARAWICRRCPLVAILGRRQGGLPPVGDLPYPDHRLPGRPQRRRPGGHDADPSPSMRRAIDETERRRPSSDAFNREHGIVPKTVIKSVRTDRPVRRQGRAFHSEGPSPKRSGRLPRCWRRRCGRCPSVWNEYAAVLSATASSSCGDMGVGMALPRRSRTGCQTMITARRAIISSPLAQKTNSRFLAAVRRGGYHPLTAGRSASSIGRVVDEAIRAIPAHYPNVALDKFVIAQSYSPDSALAEPTGG